MDLLVLVLEFYAIVTGVTMLTSFARFFATSKKERDARKNILRKLLEKTENERKLSEDDSIMGKFINMKISGIKEGNDFKVFIFNLIMHFVPIFNLGILFGNIGDIVITFTR